MAFTYGLLVLVKIRFERGDAYPPYSSFRADPKGTKALYESLAKLQNVDVSRNFKSWQRVDIQPTTTVMLLGLAPAAVEDITGSETKSLLHRIAEGNRLVLATVSASNNANIPEYIANVQEADMPEETTDTRDAAADEDSADAQPEPSAVRDESAAIETGDLYAQSDWQSQHLSLKFAQTTTPATEALACADIGLPDTLPWRAARKLVEYDEKWQVIYQVNDSPVILQRPYGRGSIVLMTDAYLLSNEALLKERQSKLLAWLIQGSQHIVINESHLGVVEPRGITTLMREYKLGGFALSLLFVALLLIWKSSQSLLPPDPEMPGTSHARLARRNLQSGYRDLLMRCIPTRELLDVCIREWRSSHTPKERNQPQMQKTLKAVDQFLQTDVPKSKRSARTVILYRELQHIINPLKK